MTIDARWYSANATHRFQQFQPGSELVEKVDQPNRPKTVFPQKITQKNLNKST